MTELFLPPPFDAAELRALILGPDAAARRAAGDARRPCALAPTPTRSASRWWREPGGRVAGVLAHRAARGARPASTSRWRSSALRRVPVTVATEGGAAAAEAYVFDPAAAPDGGLAGRALPGGAPRALRRGAGGGDGPLRPPRRGRGGAAPRTASASARSPAPAARRARRRWRSARGSAAADVAPIGREFSYARFFGMEEHRLRHRRFDGGMSDAVDRAVFTSGDAITVLPFDPRAGTVLLVEQFRSGPHARRDPRPWCLETVAGRCDRSEPPEATARREAREEANLELGRIERIAAFYPSPGIVAEYITSFVAEADLGAGGGVHGLAEEHEDIRTLVVPLEPPRSPRSWPARSTPPR